MIAAASAGRRAGLRCDRGNGIGAGPRDGAEAASRRQRTLAHVDLRFPRQPQIVSVKTPPRTRTWLSKVDDTCNAVGPRSGTSQSLRITMWKVWQPIARVAGANIPTTEPGHPFQSVRAARVGSRSAPGLALAVAHGAGRLRCRRNGSSEYSAGADADRATACGLALAGGHAAAPARARGLGMRVTGRSGGGNVSGATSLGTGGGAGAMRVTGCTAVAREGRDASGACGCTGVFRALGIGMLNFGRLLVWCSAGLRGSNARPRSLREDGSLTPTECA